MSRVRKTVVTVKFRHTYRTILILTTLGLIISITAVWLYENQAVVSEVDVNPPSIRPDVPQLPELQIDPVTSDRPTNASLLARARFLFDHHPEKDIRALIPLLDAGKIRLRLFEEKSQTNAAFGLQQKDMSRPDAIDNLIPVLSINSYWLAHYAPDATLSAMLVLSHEFVHYKQWRDGTEIHKLTFALTDSLAAQRVVSATFTVKKLCETFWLSENEAFTQQCRISRKWGVRDWNQYLCDDIDTQQWNMSLFNFYIGPVACKRVFAELVHHPHPESFPPTPNEF